MHFWWMHLFRSCSIWSKVLNRVHALYLCQSSSVVRYKIFFCQFYSFNRRQWKARFGWVEELLKHPGTTQKCMATIWKFILNNMQHTSDHKNLNLLVCFANMCHYALWLEPWEVYSCCSVCVSACLCICLSHISLQWLKVSSKTINIGLMRL